MQNSTKLNVGENYVTGLSNAFIERDFVNKIIFHKSRLAY